ncbi:MAG TPA: AEC family transporter [Thermoleophilaceae bacterium]|nr:AEC family transporter [Thermoleophilaceae bacterium]
MIPIAVTIAVATAVGFGVEHRLGELRAHRVGEQVTRLMLWVLLPPVVFFNIADLQLTAAVGLGVIFGWVGMGVAMLAAYAIGRWALRLPRTSTGTLMLAAGLSNTGYLGLPFTAALFGFAAVGDAIVFDILVSGIALLTVGFGIGAAFGTVGEAPRDRVAAFFKRNPGIWAGVAGALAPAALSPEWAVEASRIAVFAMLPLGFFVVGVALASEAEEGAIRFPPPLTAPVGVALALKLLAFPAIVFALSRAIVDVPDSYYSQAAMACGINTVLISHTYGMDRSLASSAIAWSTGIVVATGLVVALL